MSGPSTWREFLEHRGPSLEALGLAERALGREDALRAVDLVESERGTILGGDVCVEDGGRIETAYANWYSERRDDEWIESFATRTCAESRSSIAKIYTHVSIRKRKAVHTLTHPSAKLNRPEAAKADICSIRSFATLTPTATRSWSSTRATVCWMMRPRTAVASCSRCNPSGSSRMISET